MYTWVTHAGASVERCIRRVCLAWLDTHLLERSSLQADGSCVTDVFVHTTPIFTPSLAAARPEFLLLGYRQV